MGSCHSPLLPTASCCPKAAVVPVVPCWGLQGAGDGVISLGALLHHRPEGLLLSEALPPSSSACPSSGEQHGRRWQWWWLPGQPCPGGTASPACTSQQQVSSLWGRTVAPWWGGLLAGSVQSHQQPHFGCGIFLSGPGFGVAPAHPRGACVGRGGAAAAQLCLWEAVAIPLTPLSQKHPLRCTELLTQGRG